MQSSNVNTNGFSNSSPKRDGNRQNGRKNFQKQDNQQNNNQNGERRKNSNPNLRPKKRYAARTQEKLKKLGQLTNGIYLEEYLLSALQKASWDVDQAFADLSAQRNNSWSSRVKQPTPFRSGELSHPQTNQQQHQSPQLSQQHQHQQQQTQPSQHQQQLTQPSQQHQHQQQQTPQTSQHQQQQTPPSQQHQQTQSQPKHKNKRNKKANNLQNQDNGEIEVDDIKQDLELKASADSVHVEQEHENSESVDDHGADKLEEIFAKFDHKLNSIENTKQKLQSLKQEVQTFTGDCDSKIESMTKEQEELLIRQKQCEQELAVINARLNEIDTSVSNLRRDKKQKLRLLADKSRAILEEK